MYPYPPWVLQLSDFVGCCHILSDFVPLKTRSTRDRSISRSLQRWVSRKSSILQLSSFNVSNIALSLRPLYWYVFRTCMRRPGCFPGAWSSWHLQVVSLHLKSWTSLSVSFASFSILPCERAERSEAPWQGNIIYHGTRYQWNEIPYT